MPERLRTAAPKLTAMQKDRAVGAVLGSATGDALGAPYEFSHGRS